MHLISYKVNVMNYIKYALTKYFKCLGFFATIISILSLLNIRRSIAIIIIICCFLLAFLFPLFISIFKKDFKIKTIGNSTVFIHFGDIFEEDCFMVTTNRYFDVDPNEVFIADTSLLGMFVKEFYNNNIDELKQTIKEKLLIDNKENSKPTVYGETISFQKNDKLIYLMAFTDRQKKEQPKDFYIKSIKKFLDKISEENHGKTIAIPLIGNNNNLSNTGFANSEIALESLISMINEFGITNPQMELKIKIVIMPNKRSELIKIISNYLK